MENDDTDFRREAYHRSQDQRFIAGLLIVFGSIMLGAGLGMFFIGVL